jgi:endonuclease/exonuclease/phosphatase family metal-dependent hydrolase
VRVLTWNLFGGRARPAAGRDLQPEFTDALRAWEWDVALLQEVPPWWPGPLARACGASMRSVRTSRHEGMPVRRLLARRLPDLMGSWAGGANTILVRGHGISEHRRRRLRWRPERRWVHAVRLGSGAWIGNVHAQVRPHSLTRADVAAAGAALLAWAADAPVAILGGDLNVPDPVVEGLRPLGGHGVDHVFGRGVTTRDVRILDPRPLSDHRPVLVDLDRERV